MNNRQCPKCGNNSIMLDYCSRIDRLECHCHTCKYRWSEKPLDADPPSGEPVSLQTTTEDDQDPRAGRSPS